ncbi:hypothetical protein JXB28_05300 [Candidatus Woesearchaeota archaeon]|nr:hypothetical protein [Candidatus Woesearchaeota archaeon]
MGISISKLYDVCAEYNLSKADFNTCAVLNNWHSLGSELEEAVRDSQEASKKYQRPFVLQDSYAFNESITKLFYDKAYADEMLDFYRNTILPRASEKSTLASKIRGWLYRQRLYWGEP